MVSPPDRPVRRHADHDPSRICRPALGASGLCEVLGVVEVIPCADVPYRCDGFDPADWPPGEVPDFSLIREWERRTRERSDGIEA